MERDHYQVLGVDPNVGPAALSSAFRRRVMACHPDRGGSHEETVRVNEAWEILRDPDKRRRYDKARANPGSAFAQEAAAADARSAHQQAEQYPRRWADFEAWLNRASRDFTDARHSSVPGWYGSLWPTVDNSVSGWLFIIGGGLLGAVFLGIMLICFFSNVDPKALQTDRSQHGGNGAARFILILVCLPILGGAWLGSQVHQWIARSLAKRAARPPQQEQGPAAGAETPTALVTCEKCSQKLRVPHSASALIVTCRSCGHKFDYGPR
jgi:DnaJ domain